MSTIIEQLTACLWPAVDKLRKQVSLPEAIESLTVLIYLRLLSIKSEQEESNSIDASVKSRETIIIPQEFRWQEIGNCSNPCEAIFRAIEVISKLNNGLFDYFANSIRMKQLLGNQELCFQLVDIVSTLNFQESGEYDLSQIADLLTAIFSESLGVRGGEFYTPRDITNLIVELANPQPDNSIYDPACGTGGFLLAAYDYANRSSKSDRMPSIFGCDINSQTANMARINAVLHGLPADSIKSGNSLFDSFQEGEQAYFDIVITNPPIGLRHDELTLDRLRHSSGTNFIYGPPTRISDFNFIQHALSKLTNKGKVVILTSLRPLFVSGQEGEIRRRLVDSDIIEAVITLPPNILPHTGAQSAILLFNKAKSISMQGHILFIHADNEFEQGTKSRRVIGNNNRQKILQVFRSETIERKFSAIVTIEEIATNEYVLIPANYVGLDEIDVFLGNDVEYIEINQIGSVLQGAKLGQRKEGSTPIIQGRDLSVPFLSVDDLSKKEIPQDISKVSISQAGDVLIQRIGQTPRALLVEENLAGIPVSETVYIIRPNQDDRLRGRYLVEFFNSSAGQAKLAAYLGGAVIPTLSVAKLRKSKVPIPNQSIMEFIKDLQDVERALTSRIQKARALRSQLFSIDNADKFNQQLQSLSVESQVLKQSIIQSDDINFQIRNYFPHVVSFAYRSLDAIQNEAQLYKEQLRVAENIVAFLGSIGLALVIGANAIQGSDPRRFTHQMIRDYWQGGISPGDWQDMASRSGAVLRSNEQHAAITSFANLWFKGRGSKQSQFGRILQELINRKNDFKHDRGPQTNYEYAEATGALGHDLKICLQELAFFVQHPMRFVQDSDVDWRSGKTKLSTLVYVGDHPGLRQEKISVDDPLPKDKLYLEINEGQLLPLYPLISVQYCTSCKARETYFVDRWEASDGKTILKSFERGHTHSNNDVARQVGADLDYWLQPSFQT